MNLLDPESVQRELDSTPAWLVRVLREYGFEELWPVKPVPLCLVPKEEP